MAKKQSSPKMSSLAGDMMADSQKYIDDSVTYMFDETGKATIPSAMVPLSFLENVKSLCGSVISQDETKGQE